MAADAGRALHGDVMARQLFDIRSNRGRYAEGPAHQDHQDRENTQGTHRAAPHHAAITRARSLDIEGGWLVHGLVRWLRC